MAIKKTGDRAVREKQELIQGCRIRVATGRVGPRWTAALVFAACSAGCSDTLGPTERLDVAVIGYFFDDAPRITVPDTVTAGQVFSVVVESYGNSCVRLGWTDVAALAGGAVVTPLDFVRTGGVCEDILLTFRHEASLSLDTPGLNVVLVRGRKVPEGPIEDFLHEIWVQ